MKRREAGAALGKWLLLLVAIGALFGFFYWKSGYGVTGNVSPVPFETHDYVVFVRQDAAGKQDLFTVNADTGETRQLTADGEGKRSPRWSPDGKQLAYVAEDRKQSAGTYQVYTLGAGKPVSLTYGSTAKDDPRWSPDGKIIAYLSGGTIRAVRPNGEAAAQIYPPPHKGGSAAANADQGDSHSDDADALTHPPIQDFEWSPTGLYIAAVQVFEGENASTLGEREWWTPKEKGAAPAAEPSGGMIDPEGVLLLPQVGRATPVGLNSGNRVGLAWMPDGQQIAVAYSTHDRGHGIILRHVDDPNLTPRGLFGAIGYTVAPESPAISPDGKSVVFEVVRLDSAENREVIGLAVIPTDLTSPLVIRTPADIGKLRLVVNGPARNPIWSADSKRVLYSLTSKSGGRDIWVVNADGTSPKNLTKGQGDNSDAAWSPAP